MPRIKDADQLGDELLDLMDATLKDPRLLNKLDTWANATGKRMQIAKLQLEYALSKGEEPDIPFLGKTSGKPLKGRVKLLKP